MPRIIVVGHSPARGYEDKPAILNGCQTGETWRKWCAEYLSFLKPEELEYMNVLEPDGRELSVKFRRMFAKTAQRSITATELQSCVFIVLGDTTRRIFDRYTLNYTHKMHVFYLPHPSGRNRKLNDPKYLPEKMKEVREPLRKTIECIDTLFKIREERLGGDVPFDAT